MNGQLSIIESQSNSFVPTLEKFAKMIEESADDGVELSVLDVDTVESVHKTLVASHGLSRSCLYWMRQKKGYLTLGYKSFEEYAEACFGFSRQHINRLADAYMIQNVIEPIGAKEIAESVTRSLGQVPDDVKKKIWAEATAEAEAKNKKVTAKMVEQKVTQYKADHAVLQKSLDDANEKLANIETVDIDAIVENAVKQVESEMQARWDKTNDERLSIINQKQRLEKEIEALKANDTNDNHAVIENAEAHLDELNIQIESKKELLEKMTSDYETNHEITSYCETLREQMAIVMAQLQGVKGVTKDLYEETNAHIHNTAEMLEQFAQQLRNFATDNAEFSMI